ncbi:MAG: heavy-metal-associated domain-containing protein [Ekhidna sp.]|nr:heavy-metal-associated domain-containing protein [Ekhidna sp.]
MNNETIQIENLKCEGCANTIKNNVLKLDLIREVNINLERSEVQVFSDVVIDREKVISVLGKLGYPELGTGNTFQKAKSYFSCAVGKMS